MLKSCKYCNRIHDSKFDCGKKPKRKVKDDTISRFRWTRAWSSKSLIVKQRDKFLCQVCKQSGRYTYKNLEVHHIVTLREDFNLRLSEDNLITLCEYHHELAERGEITREYLLDLILRE